MSTAVAPMPVTARLRAETRTAHVRLEGDLALLGAPVGVARYRLLLERFYGFHAVLEPRLDAWHRDEPLLDWPPRRKLPLLGADLASLGNRPDAIAGLPRCAEVPQISSTADALGVLYVVEGATLGGRLIVEHLTGAGVGAGAVAFFSSYGLHIGRRWHRWRHVTTAWVGEDRGRGDAVVAAAGCTFDVLSRWLAPAGAHP